MDKFVVTLPNERANTYKWVSFIIAFMSMLFLVFVRSRTENETLRFFTGLGFIWIITSFPSYWLAKFQNKIIIILIPTFASSLIWLFSGFYLLGIISCLFSFFGFISNRKQAVKVSEAGVIYPSFPSKLFEWKEIDQVLVKDDVLTIDLKNNKLIQISILEKENEKLDTNLFNAFCRKLIQANP